MRRHEADELSIQNVDAAARGFARDRGHDLVQGGMLQIEHVHAHLDSARTREHETDRLDTWHSSVRLADRTCDLAGNTYVIRRENDVVGDERPPRSDQDRTGSRVELAWAVLGDELAGAHPAGELVQAPAPEERRALPVADIAVEKDRELELLADPSRNLVRYVLRQRELSRDEWNEGHDVDGTDARMDPLVSLQIDASAGFGDPREERIGEPTGVAYEREHRPVMVGIGVDVQQGRIPGENPAESGDDRRVASFGHVRHRLEHDPYPTAT